MKNNKKGFTLIEMMVVIVIVAILVAVIIPIVNGSTVKAAAATNAANLRGVEGQLVSIMLSDPEAFDAADKAIRDGEIEDTQEGIAWTKNRIAELQGILADEQATLDRTEAAIKAANRTLNALGTVMSYVGNPDSWTEDSIAAESVSHNCNNDKVCTALKAVSWFTGYSCKLPVKSTYVAAKKTLANEDAIKQAALERYREAEAELAELDGDLDGWSAELDAEREGMYSYVAENGWITLDNGMKVEAPAAQKVKTDNIDCPVNTQMVVYVDTTNYIFDAVYVTYDKEVFQAIADEK